MIMDPSPDNTIGGTAQGTPRGAPSYREDPPLGFVLFRLMRATILDHRGSPLLDSLPLAQLRLLWTVYYHTLGTMREYSERLGVSQSTITQHTDRLVRRGLIDRQPDLHDRRVIRLMVSEAAQSILGAVDTAHRSVVRAIWQEMDDAEQALTVTMMERLASAAEEYHVRAGTPLPPLGDSEAHSETPTAPETAGVQPMFDLLTRKVRGAG